MDVIETLTSRNTSFAARDFRAELRINPTANLMVIGCVDPRVDPTYVLGLQQGEAAVVRNVGGRITPATVRTLGMLGKVGQANRDPNGPVGPMNLVILHHTDCGMTDLAAFPDLLAEYFEIPLAELEAKGVSEPRRSVTVDAGVVGALPGAPFTVSGLVYDVATGQLETVVAPTPR